MNEYRFMYLNYANADKHFICQTIVRMAYEKMVQEGLFATVFHDGSVQTLEDMQDYLLRPGQMPFAIFADSGELAAFVWLNGYEWRSARGHFVFFKKFWGRVKSIHLGRSIFAYLMQLKDAEGYLFDVLVGITPKNNPLAWRRAIECGARLVGTIPQYCFMADTGESMDAVAVAVTRESLEGRKHG